MAGSPFRANGPHGLPVSRRSCQAELAKEVRLMKIVQSVCNGTPGELMRMRLVLTALIEIRAQFCAGDRFELREKQPDRFDRDGVLNAPAARKGKGVEAEKGAYILRVQACSVSPAGSEAPKACAVGVAFNVKIPQIFV